MEIVTYETNPHMYESSLLKYTCSKYDDIKLTEKTPSTFVWSTAFAEDILKVVYDKPHKHKCWEKATIEDIKNVMRKYIS